MFRHHNPLVSLHVPISLEQYFEQKGSNDVPRRRSTRVPPLLLAVLPSLGLTVLSLSSVLLLSSIQLSTIRSRPSQGCPSRRSAVVRSCASTLLLLRLLLLRLLLLGVGAVLALLLELLTVGVVLASLDGRAAVRLLTAVRRLLLRAAVLRLSQSTAALSGSCSVFQTMKIKRTWPWGPYELEPCCWLRGRIARKKMGQNHAPFPSQLKRAPRSKRGRRTRRLLRAAAAAVGGTGLPAGCWA